VHGSAIKTGLILFLAIFLLSFSMTLPGKVNPELFKGLKARSIGPANMSGRIASIDVVLSNTDIIYVGAATGGLWKSTNGGITWKPIFDDQPASSIGAIQIFQANPNILWVGTGEANPRNSVGVGRGVFKSLDGGKTWMPLGLEKTEKISRILLHPTNPDIAYAAAMGTTWGENAERGVFKTTDGGKSWQKILYVDDKTGAADLVMEPGNPNKLIVAMWEHRRWPWFFNSGGPGSGIHITIDGGKKWQRITDKDGLPKGELGRIGLAFAENKTNIVYALVEAKKNALYRSDDGGFKWRMINSERGVNGRPFYYCDIRVNPVNENIVYSLQSSIKVSEDGGKKFKALASFFQAHSDHHAMWNHPNGDHIIVGNDGGIVISRDRGKNWQFVGNLPLAQFYHISFDMDIPYNVYGGLQDNGSWRGPSNVLTDRFIYPYHWRMVGFGDGFDTEPDPENSKNGYAMSQGGNLFYYNTDTGLSIPIRPTESDVKHRYHWNAALAIDPFEPATIYYGSQFVHKSKNKGYSWEIISPDLTTNDPEKQKQAESGGLTLDVTNAENHTTIISIAPSPVKKDVIWVGTDDGNVQLTQDGGKNWTLVSKAIVGQKGKKLKKGNVPYGTWVSHVEASKFEAGNAFVVFEDHRRSNWTPYIFAVSNYGKTWKPLSPSQIDGFVHVIEQDHVNKDLLFLGTEFGLYISFNGGKDWMKWSHGIPTVPVRDMNIHPREDDLIIGTHGRAAYILDDISPLRDINETLLKKELHLFNIKDSTLFYTSWASIYVSPGDATFKGKKRPNGALITFLWNKKNDSKEKVVESKEKKEKDKKKKKDKLKVEVLDKEGKVVRELKVKPKKGLNRIAWDFTRKPFKRPGRSSRMSFYGGGGLSVLPGKYTVRFTFGDQKLEKTVTVKKDPRLNIDEKVLGKNFDINMEMGKWFNALSDIHENIEKTKKTIKTVRKLAGNLEKKEVKKELLKACDELEKKFKSFSKNIFFDRSKQGITDRSDNLMMDIYMTYYGQADAYYPITQAMAHKFKKTQTKVEKTLKEANTLFTTDVANFKKAYEKSGLSLFKAHKPFTLKEKKEDKKKESEDK
jgi:photosystem II stability/assembly factor-like uncharacterized protein